MACVIPGVSCLGGGPIYVVPLPPGGDEAPVAAAGKHNVNFAKICIINNRDGKGSNGGPVVFYLRDIEVIQYTAI